MPYDTLIIAPLKEFMLRVLGFVPTLLVALAILVVGWIVARSMRRVLHEVFHVIHLDKFADSVGVARVLRIGGIRHKASELLSCLAYWVLMVFVLLITVKALGLGVAAVLLNALVAYIPHVITGTIVLVVGMLLAKVVASVVYVTAKNTDMPMPEGLSTLAKLAIVVYVTIIYLKEIGFLSLFAGINYTIFLGGIIFALALAFGLAGKDIAGKYLDVFKVKHHHAHK